MTIEVELHDGKIAEFDDGTPVDVMTRAAMNYAGLAAPVKPAAPQRTAPQALSVPGSTFESEMTGAPPVEQRPTAVMESFQARQPSMPPDKTRGQDFAAQQAALSPKRMSNDIQPAPAPVANWREDVADNAMGRPVRPAPMRQPTVGEIAMQQQPLDSGDGYVEQKGPRMPIGAGTRMEAVRAMPAIAGHTAVQNVAGLLRIPAEIATDFGVPGARDLANTAIAAATAADKAAKRAMLPFTDTGFKEPGGTPPEKIPGKVIDWLLAPSNIAQVGQQVPQLLGAGGALVGAKVGATLLATIGLPVLGQSYHDYRTKGYEGPLALLGGLGQAATETLPEMWWIKIAKTTKLGDLKGFTSMTSDEQKGVITGLAKGYLKIGASELTNEEVSTIGNWIVDKAMGEPDATLERLASDLQETVRQVALFAPVMAGVAHAGQAAEREMARRAAAAPRGRPAPGFTPTPTPAAAAVRRALQPGTRGDLEAVMADQRPLKTIRGEQAAEGAAALQPAVQEMTSAAAQQTVSDAAVQDQQAEAAGIPKVGEQAMIAGLDGSDPERVTIRKVFQVTNPATGQLVSGAAVELANGQVIELTTADAKISAVPLGEGTPGSPIVAETPAAIEQAGARAVEPTPGQAEAGNYRKGHVDFQGLNVTIENPKGSVRRSKDPARPWEVKMENHYGYIKRTEGADGEHVDVYMGDVPRSQQVWIVDQIDPATKKFDEHKTFIGFPTAVAAMRAYRAGFSDGSGPTRMGRITHMPMAQFKEWLKGDTTKPVAYVEQKPVAQPQGEPHVPTQEVSPTTEQQPGGPETQVRGEAGPTVPEKGGSADTGRPAGQIGGGYTKPEGPAVPAVPKAGGEATGPNVTPPTGAEPGKGVEPAGDSGVPRPAGTGTDQVPAGPVDRFKQPRRNAFMGQRGLFHVDFPDTISASAFDAAAKWSGMIRKNETEAARTARMAAARAIGQALGKQFSMTEHEALNAAADYRTSILEGVKKLGGYTGVKEDDRTFAAPKFEKPAARVQPEGPTTPPVEPQPPVAQPPAPPVAPKTPKQPKPEKVELTAAEKLHGEILGALENNDRDAIGKIIYEDTPVTDVTRPEIDPADRLVRLTVKTAAKDRVQKRLSDLGFKVSDLQDVTADDGTSKDGVIKMSAIYRPSKDKIGDFGEKIGGKRADQYDPKEITEDLPDDNEKAVESILRSIDKKRLVTAEMPGQSFGQFMFLEALWDRAKAPGEFIAEQIGTYNMAAWKASIIDRYEQAGGPEKIQALAKKYADTLLAVQKLVEGKQRVVETTQALVDGLKGSGVGPNTDLAQSFNSIWPRGWDSTTADLQRKFGPGEDSTDQTNREVKKDDDPAPLAEIIRKGTDWRKGAAVTPEMFTEKFGFRGVDFGNWMTVDERQAGLNYAYDAASDLAEMTGLPAKVIGLGGTLGFGIGSRGKGGKAAATFHSDNNVINLTKTKGNGTLYHEWLHALEHYLRGEPMGKRQTDSVRDALRMKPIISRLEPIFRAKLSEDASTGRDRNVPPKERALKWAQNDQPARGEGWWTHHYGILTQTSYAANALIMDGGQAKYWATPHELFARAWESFTYDESKGQSPYGVGPHVADGYWTGKNGFKGTAYPEGDERAYVTQVMKWFVETLEVDAAGTITIKDGAPSVTERQQAEAQKEVDRLIANIDKIMEEMGIRQYPELKDGSMTESMFYHMRNGWWPKDKHALKAFVSQAHGIKITEVDDYMLRQGIEDFEAGMARFAGQLIVDWKKNGLDERTIYDKLFAMYDKQPLLDIKTASVVMNQQYSTPLPLAFAMGYIGHVDGKTVGFDMTAGNGLLGITLNPKKFIANELDPRRFKNLQILETRAHQGDALTTRERGVYKVQEADTVLFNPPFGLMTDPQKTEDGHVIKRLDQWLTVNNMDAMADKGRGVLILGASRDAGVINQNELDFFHWLWTNYNVVDHFEVSGEFYKRQGASWPIRVIVIAGRSPSKLPRPVSGAVDRMESRDALWTRVTEARDKAANPVAEGVSPRVVGPGQKPGRDGGKGRPGDVEPGVPPRVPLETGQPDRRPGSSVGAADDTGLPGALQPGDLLPGGRGPGDVGGALGRPADVPAGEPGVVGTGERGGSAAGGERAGGTLPVGDAGGWSSLTEQDLDDILGDDSPASTKEPKVRTKKRAGEPRVRGEPRAPATPRATDETTDNGDQIMAFDAIDAILNDRIEAPKPFPAGAVKKSGNLSQDLTAAQHKTIAARIATDGEWWVSSAVDDVLAAEKPASASEDASDVVFMGKQAAEPEIDGAKAKKLWPKFEEALAGYLAELKSVRDALIKLRDHMIAKYGQPIKAYIKAFIREKISAEKQSRQKQPVNNAIETADQVFYQGLSDGANIGIMVPAQQRSYVKRALTYLDNRLRNKYPDGIDQYVKEMVGYKSIEEMHKRMGGFQVDGVALQIDAMQNGSAFIVGDDCVAAGTMIYDPITRTSTAIDVLAARGAPIVVQALTPNGLRPAVASAPFKKGVANLYRVELDDGREITVTDQHRFLTPDGWRALADGLQQGHSLACVEARPACSSASDQSTHVVDGLRSRQTPEDSFARYARGFRSCGEQPRSVKGIGLASSPSPSDVRGRIRRQLQMDGPGASGECIHQNQYDGHRSRSSFSPSESRDPSLIEGRIPAFAELSSEPTRQSVRPSRQSTVSPRPQSDEAQPHSHESFEQDSPFLEGSLGDYTGWRSIVVIEFVKRAEFFDMWVPAFENYIAEGFVNHNTGVGKGRQAAAIVVWAEKEGLIPIFITAQENLYSDLYRDLKAIGYDKPEWIQPTNTHWSVTNEYDEPVAAPGKGEATGNPLMNKISDAIGARDVGTDLDVSKLLPHGRRALFTTYAQVSGQHAPPRRALIEALVRARKAVLILDESHKASGESGVGEWLINLTTGSNPKTLATHTPPPVGFFSATFAKRADSLPLYMRTDLRLIAATIPEAVASIVEGGPQMQVTISEMLVEAGQMARRERSYNGITNNFEFDEANLAVDTRTMDEVTERLRAILAANREFGAWAKQNKVAFQATVEAIFMQQAPDAWIANVTAGELDKNLGAFNFASTVHNYISQFLMAVKADRVVQRTVDGMNTANNEGAQQKFLIGLQNTMEAALNDFTEMEGVKNGDSMAGYSWRSVLSRAERRGRTVSLKIVGTQDRIRIVLPVDMIPAHVQSAFRRAQAAIQSYESALPASPLDYIRWQLEKNYVWEEGGKVRVGPTPPKGAAKVRPFVTSEITGRKHIVVYDAEGNMTLGNRDDVSKRGMISGFQNGSIDAAILNISGTTGLSLHAHADIEDQRVRHMLIVQPLADINEYKQLSGRPNRNGQVELPVYTFPGTALPAEKRPLAVLQKKLRSLTSQTKSATDSAQDIDTSDFVNEYGDIVVSRWLRDHPEYVELLGIEMPESEAGILKEAALKVSGKIAVLPVADQIEFYEEVEHNYGQYIKELTANGENKLVRRALPLKAQLLADQELGEGDPHASSPFRRGSAIQKLSVVTQNEVPTKEKMLEQIKDGLDGKKPSEVIPALEATLKVPFDEAMNQVVLQIEGYEKQLEEADIPPLERDKLTATLQSARQKAGTFTATKQTTLRYLRDYLPGNVLEMMVDDTEYTGVVTRLSYTKPAGVGHGNPYAPSRFSVAIALNAPRPAFRWSLARIEAYEEGGGKLRKRTYGNVLSEDAYTAERATDRMDSDFDPTAAKAAGGRETRYMVVGNIPAGFNMVKNRGEIVVFTYDPEAAGPETRQLAIAYPNGRTGVLMPHKFNPAKDIDEKFQIKNIQAGAALLALPLHRATIGGRFDGAAGYEKFVQSVKDNWIDLEWTAEEMFQIHTTGIHDGSGAASLKVDPRATYLYITVDNKTGRKLGTEIATDMKLKELTGGEFTKKKGSDWNLTVDISEHDLSEILRHIAGRWGLTLPSSLKPIYLRLRDTMARQDEGEVKFLGMEVPVEPKGLTDEARKVAQNKGGRSLYSLRRSVEKALGRTLPEGTYSRAVLRNSVSEGLRGLEEFFGVTAIPFKNAHPEIFDFQGAALRTDNTTFFINVNATAPAITVAAHEILHLVRQQDELLYQRLVTRIRPMMQEMEKYRAAVTVGRGGQAASIDIAEEELIADLLGDAMLDPVFAAKLYGREPTLFQRVYSFIIRTLDALGLHLQKPRKTHKYVADLQAARDVLSKILNEHYAAPRTTAASEIDMGAVNKRVRQDLDAVLKFLPGAGPSKQRGFLIAEFAGIYRALVDRRVAAQKSAERKDFFNAEVKAVGMTKALERQQEKVLAAYSEFEKDAATARARIESLADEYTRPGGKIDQMIADVEREGDARMVRETIEKTEAGIDFVTGKKLQRYAPDYGFPGDKSKGGPGRLGYQMTQYYKFKPLIRQWDLDSSSGGGTASEENVNAIRRGAQFISDRDIKQGFHTAEERDAIANYSDVKFMPAEPPAGTGVITVLNRQEGVEGALSFKRFFWNPVNAFQHFPVIAQLQKFAVRIETDMSKVERRFMSDFHDLRKKVSDPQWEELEGVLFVGDAEAVEWTDVELREGGITDPKVVTAYREFRTLIEKVGRFVDMHRRSMLPQYRARKQALLERMRTLRNMTDPEFRALYGQRARLIANIRAGGTATMNVEQLHVRLAAVEAQLNIKREGMEEFADLQEQVDHIDATLAQTSIRRRVGYVPHKFFGTFAVYRAQEEPVLNPETLEPVLDAAGEPVTVPINVLLAGEHGFFPNQTDAIAAAKKYLADNPDTELTVRPVQFKFPNSSATTLTDASYWRLMGRMGKELGLTGQDLKDVMEGVARRRFRRRIAGFTKMRTGVEGFSRDLERVMQAHLGEASRYVYLDKLKYRAINDMERMGLSPFRSSNQQYPTLGPMVEAFLRDMNGQKSTDEKAADEGINWLLSRQWALPAWMPLVGGKYIVNPATIGATVGSAAAATSFFGIATNPWIGMLIGSYVGYRFYSSLKEGGEFKTRSLTGDMMGDMAHAKLGMILNAASGIVNLTQTLVNTLPVLKPKWTTVGFAKFEEALRSYVMGKPNADWRLLERTDSASVNKFGEHKGSRVIGTGSVKALFVIPTSKMAALKYLENTKRLGSWASMLAFDSTETLNRAVSFLGGYYRAKGEGATLGDAFREGEKVMLFTQHNYGKSNKPEIIRNVFFRVPLQFKNYVAQQIAFTFDLARKGATGRSLTDVPLDRDAIIWHLTSLFLLTGAIGLPFLGILAALLRGVFDYDIMDELKKKALEMQAHGKLSGAAWTTLARGMPAAVMGEDLSSRAGMGEQFLPFDPSNPWGPWIGTVKNQIALGEMQAGFVDQLANISPAAKPFKAMEAMANGLPARDLILRPKTFFEALADDKIDWTNPWKNGYTEYDQTMISKSDVIRMGAGGTPTTVSELRDIEKIAQHETDQHKKQTRLYVSRVITAARRLEDDPVELNKVLDNVAAQMEKDKFVVSAATMRSSYQNAFTPRVLRTLKSVPRAVKPEIAGMIEPLMQQQQEARP